MLVLSWTMHNIAEKHNDIHYMDPRTNALRIGTELYSPKFTYTIDAVLGQGGFGITYLATAEVMVGDIPQEFHFAIKEHFVSELCERDTNTLRVQYSRPVASAVERSRRDFIREANRLKDLGISHPNIVRINEVFESNNTAYYVMQYLGDTSLQSYVKQAGRLSVAQARGMLEPIMEAVSMLHDHHVAHYDIKPANIMLHRHRGALTPVLIDFGLSKHYDDEGNATSTIGTGGFSPGYSPIEQKGGVKEYSPLCDVYALAATAYFCLTGERPPEALKARPEALMAELRKVTDEATAKGIVHGMATMDYNRTPDVRTLIAEVFGTTPAATPSPISDTSNEATIINVTPLPSTPKPATPAEVKIEKEEGTSTHGKNEKKKKKNYKWLIIPLVIVVCGAIAFVYGVGTIFSDFVGNGDAYSNKDSIVSSTEMRYKPNNLDLMVKGDGKMGYFNQDEWAGMSEAEKSKFSKEGLMVKGGGEEFILDLDPTEPMDWYEADRLYGGRLPTFNQLDEMYNQREAINKAIKAYGGTVPTYCDGYWGKSVSPSWAFYVNMTSGSFEYIPKTSLDRVRGATTVTVGPGRCDWALPTD